MLGYFLIWFALLFTAIAIFYYFRASHTARSMTGQAVTDLRAGSVFYRIAAVCMGIAAAYFALLVLRDQFQYAYIYAYSARELPLVYKVSAMWAGPEGAVLLWGLFHVLCGLLLLRQRDVVTGVMLVYCLLQLAFLMIIVIKSPFVMLPSYEANSQELNLAWQNPWAATHSLLEILGYAMLAVPFSYAMHGLYTESHKRWLGHALPWVLAAWAVLGASIFTGGVWFYHILGTGDYWAWDPAESAIFVPWLLSGASVHLILLARVRPVALKQVYPVVLFTFFLIYYSMFLIYGGILKDLSIHAFADQTMGSAWIVLFTVGSLVTLHLLSKRWYGLPQGERYPAVHSHEFLLMAAASGFIVLAAIVVIAMSMPLITYGLGPVEKANPALFNMIALVFAAIMAILLAAAPVLLRNSQSGSFVKHSGVPFFGCAIGVGLALYFGVRQPAIIITVGFAVAAWGSSLRVMVKKGYSGVAGAAHMGMHILLVGLLIASGASEAVTVSFKPGETRHVFGTRITYHGSEPAKAGSEIAQYFSLEGKRNTNVQVNRQLDSEGVELMHNPAVQRSLVADLYLLPAHAHNPKKEVVLKQGAEVVVDQMSLHFIRLESGTDTDTGTAYVKAVLQVAKNGERQEIRPQIALIGRESPPVIVFGQYKVALTGVAPFTASIHIMVQDLAADTGKESIDVAVTRKPLVNLIWIGAISTAAAISWASLRSFQSLHSNSR